MRIVQTLSILPTSNPYRFSFGWLTPEHHLMAWCFSCLQLKKLGYEPHLFCNNEAAQLLIHDLALPYSKVIVSHNNYYLPDERLWALSKIHTYGLQTDPFLHIDGDVFLFERLPEKLLQGQVIAQNLEEATAFYTNAQEGYMKHFSYLPPEVKQDFFSGQPIKAVNAGILGGTNALFFQAYAHEAIAYVKRNERHLSDVAIDQFNVFFEQHLCYSMATRRNIKIELLFEQEFKDNQYTGLANFHETPLKRNYLHLLGHFKRDQFACQEMAAHFRVLYPEYYYRVMDYCRKNKSKTDTSYYSIEMQATSCAAFNTLCANAEEFFNATTASTCHSFSKKEWNAHWHEKYEALAIWIAQMVPDEPEQHNMLQDLQQHKHNAMAYYAGCKNVMDEWKLGRDLVATNWWPQIFERPNLDYSIMLAPVPNSTVVESKYNWGAFLFATHAEGRPFYENINLVPGTFYSLFLPQPGENLMSVFDIEDVEYIILEQLTISPTKLNELLHNLLAFADEEVAANHQQVYFDMILAYIEQLVLKKAICPITS